MALFGRRLYSNPGVGGSSLPLPNWPVVTQEWAVEMLAICCLPAGWLAFARLLLMLSSVCLGGHPLVLRC